MSGTRDFRRWLLVAAVTFAGLLAIALYIWRDDITEAWLDPKVPFTVYRPPPAPDYSRASSWALLSRSGPVEPVAVFFVHPTTFDGGKDWNGPIADKGAADLFASVMAPNYAAPFAAVGQVFAPRYRQASLYTSLSLFDDALESREFAYRDVKSSFNYFIHNLAAGRPFILVGVEQGGLLAVRLLKDEISASPDLRHRLVAAYLQEAVVPADQFTQGSPMPACRNSQETACVLAWVSVRSGDFARALRIYHRSVVWDDQGRLAPLGERLPLCVNPLLGGVGNDVADEKLNLGAANASGIEWGLRPGFLARQVGAVCKGGILNVTRPRSTSLQPPLTWPQRLRAVPFNLFYANLAADAHVRVAAWRQANPPH